MKKRILCLIEITIYQKSNPKEKSDITKSLNLAVRKFAMESAKRMPDSKDHCHL